MGGIYDECDSGVAGKRIRPMRIGGRDSLEVQVSELDRRVTALEALYDPADL
jgi:hypothetical protein